MDDIMDSTTNNLVDDLPAIERATETTNKPSEEQETMENSNMDVDKEYEMMNEHPDDSNQPSPMKDDNENDKEEEEKKISSASKESIESRDEKDDTAKTEDSNMTTPDNSNDKKIKDEEEEGQELSPKQAEKAWRRKRKRQLKKMLSGNKPSFLAILNQPIEVISDDDDEEKEDGKNNGASVTKVVIDVDEYLGLDKKPNLPPSAQVASTSSDNNNINSTGYRLRPSPMAAASSSMVTRAPNIPTPTPVDEGFYEGVRLMAMPEDEIYVSELQQWIRQNLEYFSATEFDAQMSQSGRRTKAVRGKVGVRCIHCARHYLPIFRSKQDTPAIRNEQWPPGSVSYPATIEGLYSSCSQRPQLHFINCPHIPHNVRMQGSQWWGSGNDNISITTSSTGGDAYPPAKRRRRLKEGISALMYYHIACARIGLVEAPGGLRFSRDLSLPPLPLEEVRVQVEEERPELMPKPRQRHFMGPDRASSSAATAAAAARAAKGKTPCTNEECQEVIQEALKEEDDLETRLACNSDHSLVTDFTFLAIKQMAICHASAMDFVSRGKKTKLMRLGFAGFCCRHCHALNIRTHACRSFSSAPDNLASAISNSFVLHLAKCPHTPIKIKQALNALKKIHPRQMQQLPYGSQRKCFFQMWDRMRAADKIVEGEELPNAEELATAASKSMAVRPDFSSSNSTAAVETAIESNRKNSRSAGFPVSSNPNSLKVLKEAEETWDPVNDNDNLMEKDDRYLISDYVFLTMRQLKLALPTPSDFRGNRRNNVLMRIAGMCCKHCDSANSFVASGRTFPSAPDNMASAFNSSLYNHLQNCPGISVELKEAFQDLRKIHSMQCQNLVFGSQRKFFNKVYAKLKEVPIPEHLIQANNAAAAAKIPMVRASTAGAVGTTSAADSKVLQKYHFVVGESPEDGFPRYYQCLQCRAVPYEFRAPGGVHNSRPTILSLQQHANLCQKDGLYLGFVKKAKDVLLSAHLSPLSEKESVRELVRCVVGGDEELMKLLISPEESTANTSGWWKRLPSTVDFDRVQELFDEVAIDLNLTSSHRLRDHPTWLRYLQLISPSLQVPVTEEEEDVPVEDTGAGDERPDPVGSVNHPFLTMGSTTAAEATSSNSAIDVDAEDSILI
eukprot:scaffold1648_cov115-Cylindrotheca_fusiformis.AAC.12